MNHGEESKMRSGSTPERPSESMVERLMTELSVRQEAFKSGQHIAHVTGNELGRIGVVHNEL